MEKNIKKLSVWCVTGISRLTGERQAITGACTKETAQELCEKQKGIRPRKRVYLRPRVDRIENFTPPYFGGLFSNR